MSEYSRRADAPYFLLTWVLGDLLTYLLADSSGDTDARGGGAPRRASKKVTRVCSARVLTHAPHAHAHALTHSLTHSLLTFLLTYLLTPSRRGGAATVVGASAASRVCSSDRIVPYRIVSYRIVSYLILSQAVLVSTDVQRDLT